jgi:hypothetical protein
MQRLQEFAVVLTAPAAARACRPERLNDDLPLGTCHLSQHDRSVSKIGSSQPTSSESLMPSDVNPLTFYSPHSVHTA